MKMHKMKTKFINKYKIFKINVKTFEKNSIHTIIVYNEE